MKILVDECGSPFRAVTVKERQRIYAIKPGALILLRVMSTEYRPTTAEQKRLLRVAASGSNALPNYLCGVISCQFPRRVAPGL